MAAAVVLSSCSKKEDTDLRDDMVGSYKYKATAYILGTMAIHETTEGTLDVVKHASDNKAIDFKEKGELMFRGNKLEAAANGVVFDIVPQTFRDSDGDTFTIEGIDHIVLGTAKYHGAYFSSTKKIEAAFKMKFTIENEEVDGIMVFECTKR